jgi:hypothetical protein
MNNIGTAKRITALYTFDTHQSIQDILFQSNPKLPTLIATTANIAIIRTKSAQRYRFQVTGFWIKLSIGFLKYVLIIYVVQWLAFSRI